MVKKKASLALLPLTLCFSSLPVLAATTADLEKRLEQQEKQIKRLENRLKGTRSAVKENRSRISDAADRLKINGFLTAGAAVNDGDDLEEPFYGIDDDYSTKAVSKLGVQMTFEVTEKWDATAQLVSRGTNDYSIEAEWAYLSWEATNDITVKFGRSRIPYYLLSEYIDVGYALPWIIPPIEMYNIPLSTTDGISAVYDFNFGPVNFAWQAYAGATSGRSDQLEADFESNQSWGTNLVAEIDSWTFRVGYSSARLKADPDPGGTADQLISALKSANEDLGPLLGVPTTAVYDQGLGNLNTDYISGAFMFDNGKLLVMGEISNLSVDDTYQPVGDAGYITVGYRFGKWMPHFTFAKFQTDSKNDQQARDVQEYADAVAAAAYPAGLAYNIGVNGLLGNGFPSTYVVSQAACSSPPSAAVPTGCDVTTVANMELRDTLLGAAEGLSTTLHNATESQVQEQQSYTIGLVYDVNPRVKAKLQATHYESFGSNTYQTYNTTTIVPNAVTSHDGISTYESHSNGRFSGDPGAAGNHTAIYSFSIDAVF